METKREFMFIGGPADGRALVIRDHIDSYRFPKQVEVRFSGTENPDLKETIVEFCSYSKIMIQIEGELYWVFILNSIISELDLTSNNLFHTFHSQLSEAAQNDIGRVYPNPRGSR